MPHSRRSAMFWAPARLPAFTPPAHRRATGGNSREPAHQLHRHDRDALAPAKLPGHRERGALVAGRKMPPYRLGDRNGGINSWPRRHLGGSAAGLNNHRSGEVQVKNQGRVLRPTAGAPAERGRRLPFRRGPRRSPRVSLAGPEPCTARITSPLTPQPLRRTTCTDPAARVSHRRVRRQQPQAFRAGGVKGRCFRRSAR